MAVGQMRPSPDGEFNAEQAALHRLNLAEKDVQENLAKKDKADASPDPILSAIGPELIEQRKKELENIQQKHAEEEGEERLAA